MGLAFGAGPCNITCLPYLGPVLLTTEGGMRRSWRTVVPFFAGRITGYTLLAAVAGAAGEVLLSEALLGSRGRAALGALTVVLGAYLVWRSRRSKQGCGNPSMSKPSAPEQQRGLPLGLFGMGMGMALNPCMPLSAVLVAAAATTKATSGAVLGLTFGVGAVLIPFLLFGTLVAYLGIQIRLHLQRWKTVLESGAGAVLMLLGTATALGWVRL
jgi:sulfite exporter TauE/SafE